MSRKIRTAEDATRRIIRPRARKTIEGATAADWRALWVQRVGDDVYQLHRKGGGDMGTAEAWIHLGAIPANLRPLVKRKPSHKGHSQRIANRVGQCPLALTLFPRMIPSPIAEGGHMTDATEVTATTPVVVEKLRRVPKPRRHYLEENPPPPIRA